MTTPVTDAHTDFDLLLVGGGLTNGLIALAVLERHPEARIALVERGDTLGGNHTWCLHPEDAPEAARGFLEPLLVHSWPGYEVRFPNLRRSLEGRYAAVTSERFDAVVRDALERSTGSLCVLGRTAVTIDAHEVRLDDGQRLRAGLVVDARGPELESTRGRAGYQKFIGIELRYASGHGVSRPVLMDATVPQRDGFRFFYVLPLSPTTLLVEDTRFARDPALDPLATRSEVLRYAERFGDVVEEIRSETGVLPMTFRGAADAARASEPLVLGYRGGFCHPATGYSFGVALRLACHFARLGPARALGAEFDALCASHAGQARYAEQLNWLLFHCFAPGDMWNVFERFYGLPAPLIHRFYALNLSRADRARILMGTPPRGISMRTALSHMPLVGRAT